MLLELRRELGVEHLAHQRADLIDLYNVRPGKVTVLYSGVHESFRPITDPAILASLELLGHK